MHLYPFKHILKSALMLGTAALALPVLAFAETSADSARNVQANGTVARRPALWYVDIGKTGTQCIDDPDHVHLWRAVADKPASLRISGPANFPFATISFAAGESVLTLDTATFPISDGSRMVVTDTSSGATLSQIDFVVISTPPVDRESLIAALKARGCATQADRLLALPAPKG